MTVEVARMAPSAVDMEAVTMATMVQAPRARGACGRGAAEGAAVTLDRQH